MRDDFGNENQARVLNGARQYPNATSASTEVPMDVGKILALAGGAAGVVAGAWVLLTEREKKQAPKSAFEQARALIEEAVSKAQEQGSKAESSLLAGAQGLRADAAKRGKKSKKKGQKSASRLSRKAQDERNDTVERISKLLQDAKKEAAKTYGEQASEVSGLVQHFREDAGHKLDDAKKSSQTYSKQAKKDAKRAQKEAGMLAKTLKSRAVDVEHQAEDLVGSVVLPKIKEFGQEAQHLFETGKEKSGEIRKKAESDLIPEAKKRAEEVRKHAESDLLPEAKKRAEELRKRAESEVIPEVKKKAGDISHTVEAQAADATEAVKRGGRESRSLFLWVALAGVLIFTVFLDEDQQKRLKEITFELFGEAKDMYADMKGEESTLSV